MGALGTDLGIFWRIQNIGLRFLVEVIESYMPKYQLRREAYPILEFDGMSAPIVEPKEYESFAETKRGIKRCLITYFTDVIDELERDLQINQVVRIRMEGYRPRLYHMRVGSELIYVLPIPVGAPQAARMLEILSARGVKKFMVCGGAGTLDDKKTGEKILVPTSAVRDEGTSYHYLPPAREVEINPYVLSKIMEALVEDSVDYIPVKTWTTDAIFRETVDRMKLRKSEGCDTVEMECSAFYAVAKHKGLMVGQLLYAADYLSSEGWNYRDWHTRRDKRLKLVYLALKCLMKL